MGSVDFLGNPMGLINDVSSGLEGLVKRGNVGGLFRNVAHGVSDSAAKVSQSMLIRGVVELLYIGGTNRFTV